MAAAISLASLSRIRPVGKMGLIGAAWGGAFTNGAAVLDEWDHYDDKVKVFITGGSLISDLATALFV